MQIRTLITTLLFALSAMAQADTLSPTSTSPGEALTYGACTVGNALNHSDPAASANSGTRASESDLARPYVVNYTQTAITSRLPFGTYSPIDTILARVRFAGQTCELEGAARVKFFGTESVAANDRFQAAE